MTTEVTLSALSSCKRGEKRKSLKKREKGRERGAVFPPTARRMIVSGPGRKKKKGKDHRKGREKEGKNNLRFPLALSPGPRRGKKKKKRTAAEGKKRRKRESACPTYYPRFPAADFAGRQGGKGGLESGGEERKKKTDEEKIYIFPNFLTATRQKKGGKREGKKGGRRGKEIALGLP